MKVAVVYWSGTGNTKAMADAVVEGATKGAEKVDVYEACNFNAGLVDGYDSFGLGCPSMGSEVLEEGEFQPMFDEIKSKLAGKKVGLFGSYGWGDGEWMRNWEEECKGLGANLTDSVIANGSPDDSAIASCVELGERLSK